MTNTLAFCPTLVTIPVMLWVITAHATPEATLDTSVLTYSAVCSITDSLIALAAFLTSVRIYVAVCSITDSAKPETAEPTSARIISGVCSMNE